MKKIVAFLLLGLAVVAASCGDDKKGNDNQWFLTPEAAVNGTTVEMTCQTRFGAGVLDGVHVGFTYAPVVGGSNLDFAESTNSRVDGRLISSTLSGLAPETTYIVRAFADLSTGRVESPAISFETGKGDFGPVFGTPSASAVTQTTVTLSCEFTFTDAADYTVYFRYRVSSASDYSTKDMTTGTGTKTVSLTDLTPGTDYEFQLCTKWAGGTYTSVAGTFRTESGSVTPGNTKYAGWAELPVEVTNKDYYYAYHMRTDAARVRNFSVCYSGRYRCPVWVAAPMHDSYTGSAKRRDKYIDDPNISCTQNTEYNFSSTNLTRGHMLGSSDRTITQATNDQVFYKSNIGPQIQSGFNTGGGLWNNCESWVDQQWVGKADTTYQVLGCYWENESTKVNGTTVPTHYYKVLLRTKNHVNKWVSDCSREELQCIAVFFPHNSQNGGTKPSQYVAKGFAIPVSELEKKVGVTFFPNVPNAPKDSFNASDWGL